jgi:hypothetical protein
MGGRLMLEREFIHVENHGPLIVSTNYWDLDMARGGKVFCSVNAGAIRILLPPQHRPALNAMRGAEYVILSRGPWPEARTEHGVEILFDDGTDEPYLLHLTEKSFDMLPAEPPPGREWILTVWDLKKGRPHKCLERPVRWRRVPRIPWMKPWKE